MILVSKKIKMSNVYKEGSKNSIVPYVQLGKQKKMIYKLQVLNHEQYLFEIGINRSYS